MVAARVEGGERAGRGPCPRPGKREGFTTGNDSVAVCPHFAVSQIAGTRQQACLPCAEEAGTQQNKGTQ